MDFSTICSAGFKEDRRQCCHSVRAEEKGIHQEDSQDIDTEIENWVPSKLVEGLDVLRGREDPTFPDGRRQSCYIL